MNKPAQPSMNHGSHYETTEEGRVRKVRWDAGCIQWEANDGASKR